MQWRVSAGGMGSGGGYFGTARGPEVFTAWLSDKKSPNEDQKKLLRLHPRQI